jgi:hypothetical protein
MDGTESLRERIPTRDDIDRAPRGPLGPRPHPTRCVAGTEAPTFGRSPLAMTHPGRSSGYLHTPATNFSWTALEAGTYARSCALAAPDGATWCGSVHK